MSNGANSSLIILIAFLTSFPSYISSLSLSSKASLDPVDAPDGAIALPRVLFFVIISTSIVGLPLESKTLRHFTFLISESLFI